MRSVFVGQMRWAALLLFEYSMGCVFTVILSLLHVTLLQLVRLAYGLLFCIQYVCHRII